MLLTLLFSLSLLNIVTSTCPAGTIYESDFNKCYKYVNNPASFLQAEQYCKQLSGHLVTLSNAFENGYVSGIVSGAGSPPKFWIGANTLAKTSWTWISKSSFTFTNWASGQPSGSTTNQCAAVRNSDNRWTAEVCNSALPFMCELNPNASNGSSCPLSPNCEPCPSTTCTTPRPANPTCDPSCKGLYCYDGYKLFNGTCRCYKELVFSRQDYNASKALCEEDHGTLAKITTPELNAFLHAMQSILSPWIGLQCAYNSIGTCQWQDGTNTLNTYNNFLGGRPNIGGNVYMNTDGKWICDQSPHGIAAICEKAPTNYH